MQKNFLVIFVFMFTVGFIFSPVFAQQDIPSWIKNNAGWWAAEQIDDSSFVQGIEFIMKEGLLKPNLIPDEFPAYLKTESKNWSEGIISDKEYLLILENWIESYNLKSVESITSSSYVKPTETFQNQIDTDIEIGLKVGQWVKYKIYINAGGDDSIKKSLDIQKRNTINEISKNSGFNLDNAIWIKYTVSDISGSIVTFDRSVKLATTPEIKDEFDNQFSLKIFDLKDAIDPDILANVFERKLESKQFDLAEFHPVTSYAMPTNLEFGSKFESKVGEITFQSIDEDPFNPGTKENIFSGHNIITMTIKNGVVDNDIEYDTLANFWYDRQTGILNAREWDTQVTNKNTYESGWTTLTINAVERSDDLKSTEIVKPINDRNEVLERLSYLFVESSNSKYLITNGVDSAGEQKRTSFDIIRTDDGYELGSLILYGDDKISSIRTSTLVGGEVQLFGSDRIHGLIVLSLDSNCEFLVPDHVDLYLENVDEGKAFVETKCDDFNVSRSWIETNSALKLGGFVQEITFHKETNITEQKTKNLSVDSNELLFEVFPHLQFSFNLIER